MLFLRSIDPYSPSARRLICGGKAQTSRKPFFFQPTLRKPFVLSLSTNTEVVLEIPMHTRLPELPPPPKLGLSPRTLAGCGVVGALPSLDCSCCLPHGDIIRRWRVSCCLVHFRRLLHGTEKGVCMCVRRCQPKTENSHSVYVQHSHLYSDLVVHRDQCR